MAKSLFLLGLMTFLLLSCAPKTEKSSGLDDQSGKKLSAEEQNAKAMFEYEKILDEITERGKRNMLPELEQSFRDVIVRYPDSFLAQESYWRMVELNLIYYTPPKMDEAEQLRNEFVAKYPKSRMINIIDDSIARFYYRGRYWDRLLKICSYHVRKYLETKQLESPLFMFYYAEAKFNLEDLVEAEKAYRIITRHFPGSHEARIAKDQIMEINMTKKSTDR